MRNMSVRKRTTLWIIFALAMIVTLTYAVFLLTGETVARQTARDDLREVVATNCEQIRISPDGIAPPNYFTTPVKGGLLAVDNDFLQEISGVTCGLYSGGGKLIYGIDRLHGETAELEFQEKKIRSVRSGGHTYYVLDQPVTLENDQTYWVRGMIDRAQDREPLLLVYRLALLILPILIAMAAVGGFIITRRSLRPIDEVIGQAQHIHRESDLKQRITIRTGDDELRELVDALNSMLQRLEDSYERGKRFTSVASHDLRTPISVISAQTELALEQEDLSEEERQAFTVIQRQSERMTDMVNSLLNYARLESGLETAEMKDVDLSRLAETVCEAFRIQEGDRRSIRSDITPGITVSGNEGLLQGMMENLVSNACKYGVDGGWVKVELKREEDSVRFTVEDNGVGIGRDDLEHIFDWEYRGTTASEQGGAGFGLFLVKAVADLHQGTIEVISEEGKGSRFTVTLPEGRNA